MPQIVEHVLAVTSSIEIEGLGAEPDAEADAVTGVAHLVQHLLAQSVMARAQPGQISELNIRLMADGQRVQIGGRVVVRWIGAERRRALGAVDKPL